MFDGIVDISYICMDYHNIFQRTKHISQKYIPRCHRISIRKLLRGHSLPCIRCSPLSSSVVLWEAKNVSIVYSGRAQALLSTARNTTTHKTRQANQMYPTTIW